MQNRLRSRPAGLGLWPDRRKLGFMRLVHALLCACGFALLSVPLIAHEGWLAPDAFHVATGGSVRISIMVGEDFAGEVRPFNTQRTAALHHFSAVGRTDELARVPAPPGVTSLDFPLATSGTHLFALDTQPGTIVLPPDKFLAYLTEEGLDAIAQMRRESGRDHTPGRERYRRCVKTLVRVGPASDGTYAVHTGQQLEIIPVTDPLAAHAGASLAFTVLFNSLPLAEADVRAWQGRSRDLVVLKSRTDVGGVARFTLSQTGPCLIALVHMVPLKDVPDLDWESCWASLTFELAGL